MQCYDTDCLSFFSVCVFVCQIVTILVCLFILLFPYLSTTSILWSVCHCYINSTSKSFFFSKSFVSVARMLPNCFNAWFRTEFDQIVNAKNIYRMEKLLSSCSLVGLNRISGTGLSGRPTNIHRISQHDISKVIPEYLYQIVTCCACIKEIFSLKRSICYLRAH